MTPDLFIHVHVHHRHIDCHPFGSQSLALRPPDSIGVVFRATPSVVPILRESFARFITLYVVSNSDDTRRCCNDFFEHVVPRRIRMNNRVKRRGAYHRSYLRADWRYALPEIFDILYVEYLYSASLLPAQ